MSNKDQAPFDIPDPEAAGWKEDPDRPGYWLWETDVPVSEAPDDGKQYGRQSKTWTEIAATSWNPSGGGINTNASKVIVGTEGTEGVGLYANGSLRVWETAQNNNYLWTGYGGATITSHIQADGDAKFSGKVDCGAVGRFGFASFGFNTNVVYGRGSNDVAGGVDLGTDVMRWANGYFSGTVNATSFVGDGSQLTGIDVPDLDLTGYATETWVTSGFQPKGNYLTDFTETDPTVPEHVKSITSTNISNWNTAYGWGNHASAGYATQTWINNQGFAKGSFVPTSGNTTISGTLTATDFVATSDERMKDNITPVPVGLIDNIKPAQWDWKDGSGKSAGVIAQQLQSIGLDDFVYENEDAQLGVNYNALIGVLLAEVISLKAEVEALK